MNKVLLISAMVFSTSLFGQSIYKSSVDSGGALAVNGNLEMLYTIGEVNVQELTTGNIYLSEGFINGDVTTPLSVESSDILSGLSIYPNPITSKLYIKSTVSRISSINIYTLTGQQVMSITDNFNVIDLSVLPSSVYFFKIKTESGMGTFKIVKK